MSLAEAAKKIGPAVLGITRGLVYSAPEPTGDALIFRCCNCQKVDAGWIEEGRVVLPEGWEHCIPPRLKGWPLVGQLCPACAAQNPAIKPTLRAEIAEFEAAMAKVRQALGEIT